jgi:hypothetical protein
MKIKLLTLVISLSMLAGCCASRSGCSNCTVGYWSTTCPTPSSGGLSEAAFTDVSSTCKDGPGTCGYVCGGPTCRTRSSSPNW